MMFRKIGRVSKRTSNELSFSKDQLDGQLLKFKITSSQIQPLNLDLDKLKSTLTTLSEEFRDLSLVTKTNSSIERFHKIWYRW